MLNASSIQRDTQTNSNQMTHVFSGTYLDCISCVLRLLADDVELLVCWLSSTRDW